MRGRMWRRVTLLAFAALATVVAQVPADPAGAAVPAGYRMETLVTGLDSPTSLSFGSDGRVFITEKEGRLLVLSDVNDPTPSRLRDLRDRVHNNSDRGLLAVAADPVDPDVVYLSYSLDRLPSGGAIPAYGVGNDYDPCPDGATTGCPGLSRVSRIDLGGGGETVLFEGHCQQYPFHSVGDLVIEPNGRLVASFGDGSTGSFVEYGQRGNICGDPPGAVGENLSAPTTEGGQARSQDVLTRDDPTGVHGSVLRVNRSTFAPAGDNPNAGDGEANVEAMIATGFRNPFRVAIDPDTGRYYVANVGGAGREEIQSFLPGTFTNGGWPCYEGPGTTQNTFWLTTDLCDQLIASGDHDAPLFWYTRNEPIVAGEDCPNGGLAVSALAVDRSGFGGAGLDGALYFADYTRDCIWYLPPGGPDGVLAEPQVFATGVGGIVDLEFGPDGALYALDIIGERLLRFSLTDGEQAPVADLSVVVVDGAAPRTVSLDGSDSFDPNPGDTLTYAWDVDNDGDTDRTGVTATYTYPDDGTYVVRLTVTDQTGRSSSATQSITFGAAPTLAIAEPADGRNFRVGAVVPVKSEARDAEGRVLPDGAVEWELVLHHCIPGGGCHTHGLDGIPNADGSFVMPDHEFPSDVELVATVTDPAGGTATVSTRAIYRTVDVDVVSDPTGATVLVGSTEEVAPFTRQVAVGATTSISVDDPAVIGGDPFDFVGWRLDGAAAGASPALEIAPTADVRVEARFDGGAADTERPSTPRGLDSTDLATSVRLDWRASTDNVGVVGYQVFRSTDGSLGSLYRTVGNTTTWTDTNVPAGVVYTYAVKAIDAAGNTSWRSNLESGRTTAVVDTERPSTPRGLTTEAFDWGVRLEWQPSTDNVGVTEYLIYRSTDGTFGGLWRRVDGDVTSFEHGQATPGVTYTYAVKAIDAAGNTSWRTNLSTNTAR